MSATALTFGLHRGRGVVGKLIQWQTRSDYSHVSLVLPDGRLLEARERRGVVLERTLADVRRDETVDVVRVPCTLAQRLKALDFARAQLGKDYDYTMVLRFVSRRQESRKTTGKWFCSELAFAACLEAGLVLLRDVEPWRVSPGLFAMSPLLVDEEAA